MVLSETTDDKLSKAHQELCSKLNLDPNIISTSWETFESINKKFVLEGEKLNWLGCSIYVASRGVETQTVDTSSVVRGMGLNLTTLLRYSNLSFSQFFENITTWAKMAQLPDDFRNKITHLRANFSIAYNTFKMFRPMFADIFMSPAPNSSEMEASKHRNRKNRSIPCTPFKIFEFIWNMFIVMKAQEPSCSTELIKSHHLLYCCMDLAFKNVVAADRKDLLNPTLTEELLQYNTDMRALTEVPCIVKRFCKSDSVIKEALHMKVYTFRPLVSKFLQNNTLIADKSDFTGIFDSETFDQNFRNMTNAYETHFLSHGEIDERIFLAEHKRILLEKEVVQSGISIKNLPLSDLSDTSILESPRNSTGPVTPGTPLTCRKYLGPRENTIPDTSVAEKITRLHVLINNRTTTPSDNLKKVFESCGEDPSNKIQTIISTITEKFIKEYMIITSSTEDAQSKVDIAVTLFYKYVELIFEKERSISANISAVIDKDIFYQCTFACCIEMVLYCYNFPKKFPWIIETLQLESMQFVKVIELIVRCKDNLFRELIKHLNRIEETVIESLAWKSESSIWKTIEKSKQPIPKYEDVALSGQLLYNELSKEQNAQYPASPSASDVFQSPLSQVCKNLFPSPGQSVLQVASHTHLIVPGKDGNMKLIQLMDTDKKIGSKLGSPGPKLDQPTPTVPRRTGSIAIIYRKFYYLASLRMEDLCSNLRFVDFDLKRKIWTIFEDSIRETDLIKDRHLDQLLMCAIYVICKACNVNKTPNLFSYIMKYYRQQPQASSSVYRDVLIKRKVDGETISEERGDLINFYNSVYVTAMQTYAIRFQPNANSNNNIVLSPLPASRKSLVSPCKAVSENVFVKPLETTNTPLGASFNYFFSRSPSKDLKNINRAINNNGVQGKRLLTDDDNEVPSSKRICNRKIQSLVEDRLRQNAE